MLRKTEGSSGHPPKWPVVDTLEELLVEYPRSEK